MNWLMPGRQNGAGGPDARAGKRDRAPRWMAELAAASHRSAVPAEDDRYGRLLRRFADVPGALDRAAVLPEGAGVVAAAADRRDSGGRLVWRSLPAGGARGRAAATALVRRGLSRDHCRVLPRRPDAMAAMGLSVRLSAGDRCALPSGWLRASR